MPALRIGETREEAYGAMDILATARAEPGVFTPHYPPVPTQEWMSFPWIYREHISWEWSGDILDIYNLRRAIGDISHVAHSMTERSRVWQDAGIMAQLKVCGHQTVYNEMCHLGRDAALENQIQRIQSNSKRAWEAFGNFLDNLAFVASFIPVIGQAVAVVLSMAASIATQRPIGDAAIDAIVSVVPGGAAGKRVILPAVEVAKGLISGDTFEASFIDGFRKAAYGINQEVGTAFDLVLAVARADDLQTAGFAIANSWFPGTDIFNHSVRFTIKMTEAALKGESVERVLLREVKTQIVRTDEYGLLRGEINRGVDALIREPRRYIGSIEAFARDMQMEIESAQASYMSVIRTPKGLIPNEHFRRYFTASVDPSAPLGDEAAMAERTRKWVVRKIPFRELIFEQAKIPSYQQEYLQAKPATTTPFLFDPRGKTLVLESPAAFGPSETDAAFDRLQGQAEQATLLAAVERASLQRTEEETRDTTSAEGYPNLEALGIATIASWTKKEEAVG